ncbi:unnamed protein product [Adineta steineri]|uniref:DAGKc domain-containing protein n=1 Tax=Adineta steineri TaxID=433720 RepID=A0A818WH99_9BILA|nr:unnamed protein product [Adineta steineri]
MMSSILFSTSCYIKTEPYNLCISIDNDSISTIDDLLMKIDTSEIRSNSINILDSIQIYFKSLTNDDILSERIILNKLLSIKQNEISVNKSDSSSLLQRISSKEISKDNKISSSQSTQVNLSYVDISESFLWTVKQIELEMDSTSAQQLCSVLNQYLSKLKDRPRNLLVFINPECGNGKGSAVYEEQILPLFEEAKINIKTIYTERANHARDYITEESIDDYDGLICVGGDGMFSEICHSILLKTAQQSGININDPTTHLKRPNLRIGVIPAGSTDAVAFGTTGHNDPITNALQIIVGKSLLIDIATVHNERSFVCFMATMFTYGFFGNIIEQSDNWRFFGPLRYSLAGFFQFIRNASYHTKLSITQVSEKSTEIKCEGHYEAIICLNMPCRCDKSKFGMSPSVHLADGSFDVILVKHSWRLTFLRFLHHIARHSRAVEELSNVQRYRATEVVIHPVVSRPKELGNWACDGELIEGNEIKIRAHHQLLSLFASGIHLDQIKKINEEESKVISTSAMTKISSIIDILTARPWCLVFLFFLLLFLFYYFL